MRGMAHDQDLNVHEHMKLLLCGPLPRCALKPSSLETRTGGATPPSSSASHPRGPPEEKTSSSTLESEWALVVPVTSVEAHIMWAHASIVATQRCMLAVDCSSVEAHIIWVHTSLVATQKYMLVVNCFCALPTGANCAHRPHSGTAAPSHLNTHAFHLCVWACRFFYHSALQWFPKYRCCPLSAHHHGLTANTVWLQWP